jgi:hypothetical protein
MGKVILRMRIEASFNCSNTKKCNAKGSRRPPQWANNGAAVPELTCSAGIQLNERV